MKQQKTINLENAFRDLKSGKLIGIKSMDSDRIVGRIWIEFFGGRDHLCWNHYGSGYNPAYISELRWIMKSIMHRPDYDYIVEE